VHSLVGADDGRSDQPAIIEVLEVLEVVGRLVLAVPLTPAAGASTHEAWGGSAGGGRGRPGRARTARDGTARARTGTASATRAHTRTRARPAGIAAVGTTNATTGAVPVFRAAAVPTSRTTTSRAGTSRAAAVPTSRAAAIPASRAAAVCAPTTPSTGARRTPPTGAVRTAPTSAIRTSTAAVRTETGAARAACAGARTGAEARADAAAAALLITGIGAADRSARTRERGRTTTGVRSDRWSSDRRTARRCLGADRRRRTAELGLARHAPGAAPSTLTWGVGAPGPGGRPAGRDGARARN